VDIIECDLASLESVKKASQQVRKKYSRVDVLMNNAGGIFSKKQLSDDGFELTFAMNHLGHFLLTTEILDIITNTPGSRIINVSSEGHRMGKLDFDDLMAEKKYSSIKAYANAKLANIYFTYELDRRLKGTDTTSNAVHPGVVRTNFGNDFKGPWRILFWISRPFMRSPEKGAETLIYLAASDKVNGISGKYFKDKKELQSSDISYNEESARRLWEVSEKLIQNV
jgi:NAD(P)-dependent dehydrogenase (short-subunit alcohol dehydrogenase family)